MLEAGQIIADKYKVVRLLGEGGMGAVFEAVHTGTGRHVAVKVIIAGEIGTKAGKQEVIGRFQREAKAAGSIDTQHIVQVLDTGFDARTGTPYMVMELLQGNDCQQLIASVGHVSPEVVMKIAAQACIGLHKAHGQSVVHRDMKSANLFLSRREGGEVVVKLLDFGIAKVKGDGGLSKEEAALTRTGSMLGSPLYMSPEQALGSKTIDQRTDLFSLGIVLYELLTGITPNGHHDTLGRLIMAICQEPAASVQLHAPWCPPEVAAVVHKALALSPDERFADANDMLEAIKLLLPNGWALREDELASVPDALKTFVAPKLAVTDSRSITMALTGRNDGSARDMYAATQNGLAHSKVTAPKPAPRFALAAALLLGVVGGGGYLAMNRVKAKEAAAAQPSLVERPVAASVTAAAPAPLEALPKTVRLEVSAPAGATVEIDGAPAVLAGGGVEVVGAVGSVHKVKVRSGRAETSADVVIADQGAMPAKVTLGAAPAAAPRGGGSRPAAAAAAPAAAPKPAAKPAGGLGTSSSFE